MQIWQAPVPLGRADRLAICKTFFGIANRAIGDRFAGPRPMLASCFSARLFGSLWGAVPALSGLAERLPRGRFPLRSRGVGPAR